MIGRVNNRFLFRQLNSDSGSSQATSESNDRRKRMMV